MGDSGEIAANNLDVTPIGCALGQSSGGSEPIWFSLESTGQPKQAGDNASKKGNPYNGRHKSSRI